MEDMTYDMAGSAVVGLMKTLALRKAKIMQLVCIENMPGKQRPGDIKSYSGKTIEY